MLTSYEMLADAYTMPPQTYLPIKVNSNARSNVVVSFAILHVYLLR